MRRILILTSLFLTATISVLASDCDSLIIDRAHVLIGHEPQIAAAMAALKDKGADPRVITDNPSLDTPEQYVHNAQQACPSWRSADGGMKNNLIVFLVFPQRRKVGLFIGKEFEEALHTAQIRSEYMAPAFRDGDWARGFINGAKQAAIQIEAHNTAALHPNTTVIDEKPADFSGLWIALYLIIGGGAIFALAWGLIVWQRRKREIKDAQQAAVQARNDAASRVRANPDSADAEDFAKMSNSETWNPETEGLSAEQYRRIGERYKAVAAHRVVNPYSTRSQAPAQPPSPEPPQDAAPRSDIPAPSPSHYADRETTVINNTNYVPTPYVPMPIIIDDGPRYDTRYEEPAPRYDPAPQYNPISDPEPSPTFGGSSDFGSSDDSSGGSLFSSIADSVSSFGDSGGGDGGSSDF